MLDKKRGYAFHRPFYTVDPNAVISAGMVAFLATTGTGTTVVTTAASGTVPIGTFWKDHNIVYARSTVEQHTFAAANTLTVQHANVFGGYISVTNVAGTVQYTNGLDYSVNATNGIITNLLVGIPALATVIVAYTYVIPGNQINFNGGSNYNQQPDDTLGSSSISVAEGDAKLYTDMYDVRRTYALNDTLRSDSNSLWSNHPAGAGFSSVCGRVIQVPTVAYPYLGIQQVTVTA